MLTPSGLKRSDPFKGHFGPTDGNENEPTTDGHRDLLDISRARKWFETVAWGVRTDLYTYQQALEGHSGPHVKVGGRSMLMMSSYDYLGLIGHSAIENAVVEAIRKYGTGTGGVRLLTGTTELHRELEEDLARFKGTEAALTFTSGYLANLAAICALVGPKDRVILDVRAHRSIVDACRLARVPVSHFRHNDMESLCGELERKPAVRRTLIIVEGVYSMDGDICFLPELVEMKRRHGAYLMVDEAHSFGVLGATGRGVHEHFGIAPGEVDIWMGSLSKAIPSNGGFVAGSRSLVIYLQHESAPFFFSAAACPAPVAAVRAALKVIQEEPWRLKDLAKNASRLRAGLRNLGYDIGASETPIVPVLLGENERAWRTARQLEDYGILSSAVVAPAVPQGAARLRFCTMATHTEGDIEKVVDAMGDLKCG